MQDTQRRDKIKDSIADVKAAGNALLWLAREGKADRAAGRQAGRQELGSGVAGHRQGRRGLLVTVGLLMNFC